jgi:formiminotetrahydrofolate cyclodeaminase
MPHSEPARAALRLTEALAARDPVPAGGAAAVAALAMGLAVGTKVARISRAPGRITARLAALRAAGEPLFDADCEAFRAVLAARRARAEPAVRAAAWEAATAVPLSVAALADAAQEALDALEPHCRPALRGDLEAARALVEVGGRISRTNAALNGGTTV